MRGLDKKVKTSLQQIGDLITDNQVKVTRMVEDDNRIVFGRKKAE